jgi:hypothetical protein
MTTTLLNELQRQKLRDLSRALTGDKKDYPVQPNEPLEAYLAELRDQYPEAFHSTRESLKARVFMDEPRLNATPYARSVRSYAESPIHITPVKS